jgi:hypothetical protein
VTFERKRKQEVVLGEVVSPSPTLPFSSEASEAFFDQSFLASFGSQEFYDSLSLSSELK